jgi:rubrerythrin
MSEGDSGQGVPRFDEIDVHEACCLAVAIDDERSAFYGRLSERTAHESARNELMYLRRDEKRAAEYFAQRILTGASSRGKANSCDPEGGLHRWVENEIIAPFQKARSMEGLKSPKEAIRVGLELQKKSIGFFEEILRHEQDAREIEELHAVIAYERDHLRKLQLVSSYL